MKKSSRLLGTAGRKGCRNGCLYCFTQVPGYKRCRRLDNDRPRKLIDKALEHPIVQPFCDTEFSFFPNRLSYLDDLLSTGKIISFATKTAIIEEDLQALSEINKILKVSDKVLHVGITIVRLINWKEIEPNAPDPYARIETLRRLWEAGIPTTVVMRPMVPMVSFDEIDELVERTYRYCYGYLSGPLYLTPAIEDYMNNIKQPFKVSEKIASWQEGEPLRRIVESSKLEKHLEESAQAKGRKIFKDNIEAAIYVNKACRRSYKGKSKWASTVRREPVGTVYVYNPEKEEFLMMFHRKLGKWLAPGGHVEFGEDAALAAFREAKEELGVEIEILKLKGTIDQDGDDFKCVQTERESEAFCTIEEFIHPIDSQDPHIHVDSVYVGIIKSENPPEMRDRTEVKSSDWFSLAGIEELNTFDNVPVICRSIVRALAKEIP